MKDILYPIRALHGKLHEAKLRNDCRKSYKKAFRRNPNTVFLLLTPEHGNLGDHAIAVAETSMLKNNGIDYIEITGYNLENMIRERTIGALDGFPILINGGGNLGTLWPDVERTERAIVSGNPKSPIAILPNTIFYEQSDWGRARFEESKRVYNKHKHLFLYAREESSYIIMKEAYRNVKLVPDMVFSLTPNLESFDRKGCLLCLRSDCESTMAGEQKEGIYIQIKKLFGEAVTITDMVVANRIPVCDREVELHSKFAQFASAELVVTDRLHGMVFAAITGTPCIVVNSKSPKVRGCYEWIKNLDYVRFVDDVSKIVEEYGKIPKGEHHYDNSHLKHYYDELADDIKTIIMRKKQKCR